MNTSQMENAKDILNGFFISKDSLQRNKNDFSGLLFCIHLSQPPAFSAEIATQYKQPDTVNSDWGACWLN